jgi:signal transduction histidine kinase
MELGRALTSNLHLEQLYAQVIELVERAFEPDTISVMLLNPDGERLRLVAHRGLPSGAVTGSEVTLEASIAGKVVREGRPQLLLGGLEGTGFEGLARRGRRIRSAMSVPLQTQGRTMGVINVNRFDGRATYTHHDANLLHVFAAQIAIAINNAQLYEDLREERDRIIKAQEDVRRELARDLHDGLTQVLARLALDLDFLRMQLGKGTISVPGAQDELCDLRGVVRQAIHDVRTMMFGLRPLVLETRGLVAAMEQYLAAMREGDRRMNYHLTRDEALHNYDLSPSVSRMVFAILQEAINNARKHAQGQNVWVSLRCDEGGDEPWLNAVVRDDGAGFDLEQVEGSYDERYSFGLLNMRERAQLIDARLRFRSERGHGTIVSVEVPLRVVTHEPAPRGTGRL